MLKKILEINKKYLRYHLLLCIIYQIGLMMSIGGAELIDLVQFILAILFFHTIPYLLKIKYLKLKVHEWFILEILILIECVLIFCLLAMPLVIISIYS